MLEMSAALQERAMRPSRAPANGGLLPLLLKSPIYDCNDTEEKRDRGDAIGRVDFGRPARTARIAGLTDAMPNYEKAIYDVLH
jgi:hypothetical protein